MHCHRHFLFTRSGFWNFCEEPLYYEGIYWEHEQKIHIIAKKMTYFMVSMCLKDI